MGQIQTRLLGASIMTANDMQWLDRDLANLTIDLSETQQHPIYSVG